MAATPMSATPSAPIMSIEAITRRFGGLVAVGDVSFQVAPGEIVGLIGPNGAGKTTLFDIISGHLAPNAGRVRFDGHDITRAGAPRCARYGIGRTFQIVKPLTTLTVQENVMVGTILRHPRAQASRLARHIVDRVGMGKLADQPAGSLTLESRKRLELARALSIGPKMLLLDEILAGLNTSEVNASLELIRGFAREEGLAVIMIEHILHAVMSLADRVVVLDHGQMIANDVPGNVVRDSKVIAAYLGTEP
jgi:branched-chain amino acid transport system ATP-binding protein